MTSPVVRYAALLAVVLALMSGSAYAGGKLAANSVGSKQVKNNSLKSKDVRDRSLTGVDVKDGSLGSADVQDGSLGSADVQDGSLTRTDLATGTAARTYTVIQRVPAGTTRVLEIPGFSRFDATCSPTSVGISISFGDADPATDNPVEQHGLSASDIADNSPYGGVTLTGAGGGVGFSTNGGSAPASGQFVRGDYWGRSETLLAHGTFSWGLPFVPCLFRLQLVVQELTTPSPVSRPAGLRRGADGSTCERSGSSAAYCLPAGA
jgi:hypothetical protein